MSNLTFYERQKIEFYLRCKLKLRRIARLLRRDHSVIVREVQRHKPQFSAYDAKLAQHAAERKSHHTNKRKLDQDWWLKRFVLVGLRAGWSPEQIAGRLKKYPLPNLTKKSLCMETIYQYIYNQGDGEGAWYQYLRKSKQVRQKRYARTVQMPPITGKISIHDRPNVINERKRIGDWETDLLCFGRHKETLSVQYERKSQYAHLTKLFNKTSIANSEALTKLAETLPIKSLTFDNGGENADHLKLKYDYNIKTYFCDSYASWQKGGVENLNGLLRQYLPKKTNPDTITDELVRYIQTLLNQCPRKKLGYKTPKEVIETYMKKQQMVH